LARRYRGRSQFRFQVSNFRFPFRAIRHFSDPQMTQIAQIFRSLIPRFFICENLWISHRKISVRKNYVFQNVKHKIYFSYENYHCSRNESPLVAG
jgi:hypothetical protein